MWKWSVQNILMCQWSTHTDTQVANLSLQRSINYNVRLNQNEKTCDHMSHHFYQSQVTWEYRMCLIGYTSQSYLLSINIQEHKHMNHVRTFKVIVASSEY